MRIKTLILGLCCVWTSVSAATPTVQHADSAYAAGRYSEAVELYKGIIDTQGTSAGLLYNLGNAYVRSGSPADAILYYERALRLDPGNDDIRNNLSYASAKVSDRNRADLRGKQISVGEDELSFAGRMHERVARQTSSDTWAWWGAACFIIMCALTATYIFGDDVRIRKAGFFGGMIAALSCVVFVVFAFMAAGQASRTDEGVVSAFKTTLLAEPKNGAASAAAPLNKGTKLTVLDSETDTKGNITWYKVRRNSNYVGWIKATEFEII